jgi:hypothetical protein
MRGFIILTTILAAILIGVTAASRAQAQPTTQQQFLDEARAAGYTGTDDQILRNGYLICAAQTSADDDLVQRGIDTVQRWLGQPNNPERDAAFIALAEKHLCPQAGSLP